MDEEEIVKRYWHIIKYYGNLLGIWPFDTTWRNRVLPIIVYFCCSISLLTLTSRIVVYYSFSVVTEQVPFICVAVIMLIKYTNCYVKQSQFSNIMRSMLNDWKKKKTEEEIVIMKSHAEHAVFFVLLYRISTYLGVAGFATVPFISPILDLILPSNESRPLLFAYEGYYFVDQHDHYYHIVVYTFIQILLAGLVLISNDIFMIHFVQHACALLLLAGHRFKHAADALECSIKEERYRRTGSTFRKLRFAFESHNRAIEHLSEIEAIYAMNLVLQILFMIMLFSITLFQIAINDVSPSMLRLYLFLISQTIHMLFLTIQGQFVLDSHDVVYNMIYEALWYTESTKLQVLYVVALRRSLTPPILTAGGLMRLDLNSFSVLLKACVSYYTVLRPG